MPMHLRFDEVNILHLRSPDILLHLLGCCISFVSIPSRRDCVRAGLVKHLNLYDLLAFLTHNVSFLDPGMARHIGVETITLDQRRYEMYRKTDVDQHSH